MPNASCFLIAYVSVFLSELVRFTSRSESAQRWMTRATFGLLATALVTHTLYLVARIWVSVSERGLKTVSTWHDWGMLAAWTIAVACAWMTWRRSDKQIGLFVLPLIIVLVALSMALPSASPIANPASTAFFWRMVHSAAMLVGTMLVTMGFAIATMYLVQASRLKRLGSSANSIRLPSLEYLQSIGRKCILGSAAAIGFGVVSGVIMNVTQDGQVAWTDRGILFTAGLFAWLCIAAAVQWISANRGRGEWTAAMSILSFIIVVIALAVVVSNPHGTNPPAGVDSDHTAARVPAERRA